MAHWAVIMAGGTGTRFWPASTQNNPKQFLKLNAPISLLEQTIQRLQNFYDPSKILIVTTEAQKSCLLHTLPDFPQSQTFYEPYPRNTAPCIAWMTKHILNSDPEAIIGVFPADHAIPDEQHFLVHLTQANKIAENAIILFGIIPTRPETGYGYIQTSDTLHHLSSPKTTFKVSKFTEKPDLHTAQKYLEQKNYLWNSGIFIFDAQIMHNELQKLQPELSSKILEISQKPHLLAEIFKNLPSISIDYAIMEHTDKAIVMASDFPWNDLGAWNAVAELYSKDENQNAVDAPNAILLDSKKTFIYNHEDKCIAALGLENIIIVNTPKAILVTTPEHAQKVKDIVQHLHDTQKDDLL